MVEDVKILTRQSIQLFLQILIQNLIFYQGVLVTTLKILNKLMEKLLIHYLKIQELLN